MSALDDAYQAAEAVLRDDGEDYADNSMSAYTHRCIGAFLSHLADNPPEEMVEAMMESGGRDSDNSTRDLCTRWLFAALDSIALRSIGADK